MTYYIRKEKGLLEVRTPVKMMGVIRTTAGGAEVLIETVNPTAFPGMEDSASTSALADIAKETFESARKVISGIAQEVSKSVMSGAYAPSEIKIGFSMSLTTEGNLWLIKSGSNVALNVELTWKKDEA